ncbi:hypothetical protein CMQ_6206 [Grosmannia clavigera kw1407]|uniref:Uncharacterized protein n=1 Tax=Grosmannia clavigera (strain kw1407 / UAMH 11150) TaxID=655863 RepID=F0XMC5_GROCL|nr:uncharacterized protein CMQ_6206 [Grosmannia clavigera kw1407]EFX01264.1 hypothetical protein CMQ_6206 [Grosmannia clavigera kw1407]
MPGATCECGHLACYHVSNSQPPTVSGSHDVVVLEQRLQLLEKEHVELHQLRRDFMLLQEQLNQGCFRNQELVERVSELEDATEKSKLDIDQQVREAYRNLRRAWDSINELSHHNMATDNQIQHIQENLRAVHAEIPQFGERQIEFDAEVARISQRQLELADINIALEERIESLETLDGLEERVESLEALENQRLIDNRRDAKGIEQRPFSSPALTTERALPPPSLRPRPIDGSRLIASQSISSSLSSPFSDKAASSRVQTAHRAGPAQEALPVMSFLGSSHHTDRRILPPTSIPAHPVSISQRPSSAGSNYESNELWTVHISLMPSATLPMPFERGTNAYKRCLSRGLHQMVPVNGTDAEAVERAVRKAFKGFLGDHPWIPLKAEPCTADGLTGLPMLRQLDPSLVDKPYDLQFLMDNRAVHDSNGHIDSLYIAMRDRTISWYKLRKAPIFLEGLEASWSFDTMLDNKNEPVASNGDGGGDSSEDENKGGIPRPPAGDIAACLSLKRAASEMSRSSSFGSGTTQVPTTTAAYALEGEGSRSKIPRIHPLPDLVEIRRGVTIL